MKTFLMSDASTFSVSIDTGGTFTDVVLVDHLNGETWTAKVPSTPDDPSKGFAAGIEGVLASANVDRGSVAHLFHGTTVATNAILEMKGAVSALLTTSGLRHVLEIGRHDVPRSANMYTWIKPDRPIPVERIFEVRERLDAEGKIVETLRDDDVRAAVRAIKEAGIRSIGVCFLHSYANSQHELRCREIILEEYPDALISLSSDVLPTFREYERSMATALNAYVMPIMVNYLSRIERRMLDADLDSRLLLMKSSGGVTSVATAIREPIQTTLSGPAGGIVGAKSVAETAGENNFITLDIGGTSADIALVKDGSLSLTTSGSVGEWPVSLPMLDIHTIGAGGGSIASVKEGGVLVVGPRSAAAHPGPVCYRRGGTEPTVTDAHLVLGHLSPSLLNGDLVLDREAALEAIHREIGEPLGMDAYESAQGIIEIANNNMADAIRLVSVERGLDPSDFMLVPYGGAGPLHGGFLGRILGMKGVLVPPRPGVLSSLGLLIADIKNEFSKSVLMRGPDYDLEALAAVFDSLQHAAESWLTAENIPAADQETRWFASLRYRNQGSELTVPWKHGDVSPESLADSLEGFHALHEQLYTFRQEDTSIEIAGVRVEAVGRLKKPASARIGRQSGIISAITGTQKIYHDGEMLDCILYDRSKLGYGAVVDGPAILTQLDATTYILPGQSARIDEYGNALIHER